MQPPPRSLDFGQGIFGSEVPQQIGIMLRELLMNAARDFRRSTLCRGPLRELAPAEILKRFLVHVTRPDSQPLIAESRFNIGIRQAPPITYSNSVA